MFTSGDESIFDNNLLLLAGGTKRASKQAFVDSATAGGGDPMAAGGASPMAGAMPPMPAMGPGAGGDPAAMGGDPAAMGGDPAAMGGDPAAAGGGGSAESRLANIEQQLMMLSTGGGGGAGGAGAAGPGGMPKSLKPEQLIAMQTFKLIAKLCAKVGVEITAEDMLPPNMLNGGAPPAGGAAPAAGGAAPAPTSSIAPISPLEGASPAAAGGAPPAGGASPPKTAGYEGMAVDPKTLRGDNKQASGVNQRANRLARLLSGSGICN